MISAVVVRVVQRVLQLDKIRQFKRRVPWGDLITDRTTNAKQCGFGKGTTMYDSAIVFFDKNGNPPKVGEGTWIGPNVILDNSGGGLEIGSYCTIGSGVEIYTHDSVQWAVSGGKLSYDYAPTKIGNSCFIGPKCIISRGVTIGDGCVVGAMSFVNAEVFTGQRVAGNPAKPLTDVSPSKRDMRS